MWGAGSIVQGDSGLVVSQKLDAEFARIQNNEAIIDGRLNQLVYTDDVSILDKTEAYKIVSPYTMWSALDPAFLRLDDVEDITGYFTETIFDGKFWLRTSGLVEYTGAYVPYDNLADGYFLTKAHVKYYADVALQKSILKDGSTEMDNGYIPLSEQAVATKKYADDKFNVLANAPKPQHIEYAASLAGDYIFNAPLDGVAFAVYKNGILQRKIAYTSTVSGIQFATPLDAGDEVSILILGES